MRGREGWGGRERDRERERVFHCFRAKVEYVVGEEDACREACVHVCGGACCPSPGIVAYQKRVSSRQKKGELREGRV